ncbi:MAG: hypothetical protein KAH44_04080 [Oricola sp.]|jgi:transcription antitermination factor NusG|nr:hypothetical protein [Oricola sp.]
MPKFLAIYMGSQSSAQSAAWNTMDEKTRKEREAAGMKAWMDWMTANAASIVDQGGPLGKTKRADADGVSDIRNNLTGYIIVEAESHEAAARLFENHPHFAMFPGESVEIMTCPPIPGM